MKTQVKSLNLKKTGYRDQSSSLLKIKEDLAFLLSYSIISVNRYFAVEGSDTFCSLKSELSASHT